MRFFQTICISLLFLSLLCGCNDGFSDTTKPTDDGSEFSSGVSTTTETGFDAEDTHSANQEDSTTSSVPITTNQIPFSSAQTSTTVSTTARKPNNLQNESQTKSTSTSTNRTTNVPTTAFPYTPETLCTDIVMTLDQQEYALDDEIKLFITNNTDRVVGHGLYFVILRQNENHEWETLHNTYGCVATYHSIEGKGVSSIFGVDLSEYNIQPNCAYKLALDIDYGWICADFYTISR